MSFDKDRADYIFVIWKTLHISIIDKANMYVFWSFDD